MNNKLLGFGIITYNRDYLLDHVLEELIESVRYYNIPIYIFDNHSEDKTELVFKKYKNTYDEVYYYCQEENVGPDANFSYALTHIPTQYIWMLTDGTRIIKNSIDNMIRLLEKDEYQIIVTGVKNRTEKITDKIFIDSNDLLKSIGWHMTYLGSLVYNQKIVKDLSFDRYIGSRFLQTGIIFEYLTKYKPKICFSNSVMVTEYPLMKRGHWDNRTIEIFAKDWYAFVLSLPIKYQLESKFNCIKEHDNNTGVFGIINVTSLRSANAINYSQVRKYRKYLKECTKPHRYIYIKLICIIPPWICLCIKYIYKKVKGRAFYSDRGESQVSDLKPRL